MDFNKGRGRKKVWLNEVMDSVNSDMTPDRNLWYNSTYCGHVDDELNCLMTYILCPNVAYKRYCTYLIFAILGLIDVVD